MNLNRLKVKIETMPEADKLLNYRNILPRIAGDVFIAPGARVIGDVVIGEGSSVWFNAVVRGDCFSYIRIGSFTNIQDNVCLHVSGPRYPRFPVEIGDRVTIGHNVVIHGSTIEDECLIGMGSILLDGCKIGKGSVIAAGSLIPEGFVVPPGSVVMGSPARVKKKAGDAERERIEYGWISYFMLAAHYLRNKDRALSGKALGF